MNAKYQLQVIGEDFVAEQLIKSGHKIVSRNKIYKPYEFDIISQFNNKLFVHEVRTTRQLSFDNVIRCFPTKKILVITKGASKVFPYSLPVFHLVTCNYNTVVNYQTFTADELW